MSSEWLWFVYKLLLTTVNVNIGNEVLLFNTQSKYEGHRLLPVCRESVSVFILGSVLALTEQNISLSKSVRLGTQTQLNLVGNF